LEDAEEGVEFDSFVKAMEKLYNNLNLREKDILLGIQKKNSGQNGVIN